MPGGRVVLIGWGNARPGHLAPYEALYRARGDQVSTTIPDTAAGLLRPDGYLRTVASLAADLAGNAGAHPTWVHLFSDNGFIAWAALLRTLAESGAGRRARDAIRGVVLDSSPGLWNVRGRRDFARRFARGMTPAVSRALGLGARHAVPLITPTLEAAFLAYRLAFRGPVEMMLGSADVVAREQPRCPHLFLVGEADRVVETRDVRAWIARQRAAGIDATEVAFPQGRHVALLGSDPQAYRDAIAAFTARTVDAGAGGLLAEARAQERE
ncbi:MAG: DUF829 domain-containing protein [Polyangiaceae bacterium]|nr:DUF829 domain-containing protein [Polyangiaceae bacterium]